MFFSSGKWQKIFNEKLDARNCARVDFVLKMIYQFYAWKIPWENGNFSNIPVEIVRYYKHILQYIYWYLRILLLLLIYIHILVFYFIVVRFLTPSEALRVST